MMRKGSLGMLATAAIVLGMTMLPRSAGAQSPTPKPAGQHSVQSPTHVGMTQEQDQKLGSLRAKLEARLHPLQKSLKSKRVELNLTLSRDVPEPRTVSRLRREIRSLEDQVDALEAEADAAAAKILTPEQRAYFGEAFHLIDCGDPRCPMHGGARRPMAQPWRDAGWRDAGWRDAGWRGTGWRGTGWRGTGWRGTGWRGTGCGCGYCAY